MRSFIYSRYRTERVPPITVSEAYALFPDENQPGAGPKWPDPWPNGNQQGVYLILDRDQRVLYIGKASMGNTMDSRLDSYFGYTDERLCKILGSWRERPKHVVTLAVPPGHGYEAVGLEEFLIDRLQPPENSQGIKD